MSNMGDDGDSYCTGLGLGIGLGEYIPKSDHSKEKKVVSLDLWFPHQENEEVVNTKYKKENKRRSNNDDDNDNKNNSKKKLRLSEEQSTLLEESFNLLNTLNSNRKLKLAEKLNLRPRQVEVWFQNRRARTKLKQTEVDCEYMKKCCENLSEENYRLKKELQELLELKLRPFYNQFPKPLKMCPSCSCDETISTKIKKNNAEGEEKEEEEEEEEAMNVV